LENGSFLPSRATDNDFQQQILTRVILCKNALFSGVFRVFVGFFLRVSIFPETRIAAALRRHILRKVFSNFS